MTGFITTVLQLLTHLGVRTESQIWGRYLVTQSTDRYLYRPPVWILVGADLSGIELRCLAHYLARYDGGHYAEVLLNDDIHQVNADKIGISRKQVKTVTYAMLYGASDARIGKAFDDQLPPNKAKS